MGPICIRLFPYFLLIVWLCFFFGLCLLVFSFAWYFWWIGSHPSFLYVRLFLHTFYRWVDTKLYVNINKWGIKWVIIYKVQCNFFFFFSLIFIYITSLTIISYICNINQQVCESCPSFQFCLAQISLFLTWKIWFWHIQMIFAWGEGGGGDPNLPYFPPKKIVNFFQ